MKGTESAREGWRGAASTRSRSICCGLVGALVLASALLAPACAVQERFLTPAGYWLVGDAAATRELLGRFEAFEGTPLASWSKSLRLRLSDCSTFRATTEASSATALVAAIRCGATSDPNDELEGFRAGDPLAFALPVAATGRLVGRLRIDAAGSVRAEARLEGLVATGLASLLLPGSEPAGRATLSTRDILVHARLRPADGLDLAALIDPESQADAMFRLRSQIFLTGILEGAWEVGIYTPGPQQITPPMALALDTAHEKLTAAAMQRFVAELEETWPIHHRAFRFGDHEGACIIDLHILPELMPCYVVVARRLVVGWNPASIHAALGISALPTASELGEAGGLMVYLDRLPEADRVLRESLGQPLDPRPVESIWKRLRLVGRPDGEAFDIQLELEAPRAS